MSELKNIERAAIESLVKGFCATPGEGSNPSGAALTAGGKRFAPAVAKMKGRVTKNRAPAKFHLRFDKVALRVVADLQEGLREFVPDRKTVIVTITAPIKLASKTTAALEERIRRLLTRRLAQRNIKETIHHNRIGVRVANGRVAGAKVIGFVHNPDPRAAILLNVAASLIERRAKGRLD